MSTHCLQCQHTVCHVNTLFTMSTHCLPRQHTVYHVNTLFANLLFFSLSVCSFLLLELEHSRLPDCVCPNRRGPCSVSISTGTRGLCWEFIMHSSEIVSTNQILTVHFRVFYLLVSEVILTSSSHVIVNLWQRLRHCDCHISCSWLGVDSLYNILPSVAEVKAL